MWVIKVTLLHISDFFSQHEAVIFYLYGYEIDKKKKKARTLEKIVRFRDWKKHPIF